MPVVGVHHTAVCSATYNTATDLEPTVARVCCTRSIASPAIHSFLNLLFYLISWSGFRGPPYGRFQMQSIDVALNVPLHLLHLQTIPTSLKKSSARSSFPSSGSTLYVIRTSISTFTHSH